MRRRYDTTTELPVITQTTERPARIEGVQADGLRAFFYGLAAMLFSIPVTVLASGPWYVPLAVFALIAPLAYVAHDGRAAAIAFLERQLHRDLDGDGEVGEPETVRHLATVQVQDNGHSLFVGDIPLTKEMQEFTAAVLAGDVKFTGRGAASYMVTPEDFTTAQREMIRRKVLTWKNPRNHPSGTYPHRGFRETLEGLLPPHQELLA